MQCSLVRTGHKNNTMLSLCIISLLLYSFTVRSFYSPSASENLHHLPNAAAKPVQLRLSSANPSAQVSVHLPRVRRHLSLRPFPIPCHQELPALHAPSGLPVSPHISPCAHYLITSSHLSWSGDRRFSACVVHFAEQLIIALLAAAALPPLKFYLFQLRFVHTFLMHSF